MRVFNSQSAIFRTGLLLLGVPFFFQLAALAYLASVHRATSRAEALELHSKEVIRKTARVGHVLSEAHATLRANGIFRDASFEKERRLRVREVPAMLGELRDLVQDDPAQQAKLDRVGADTRTYLAWFSRMEGYAAAGQWDRYMEIFRRLEGKRLLDAVERGLERFNLEEERLDELRRARADAARRHERAVLTGMAVIAVALAGVLLVVFARGFSARLARIATNGERLATGEPLLPALEGRDEVAGLDRVLHETARRLESAAAVEKRHAEELEARRDAAERLNKELQFKTQESEMFVYSVSHDLRSPLVNLQGFTRELLVSCDDLRVEADKLDPASPVRSRLRSILDGDMNEAVGFIQTAVTRLSGIVDALLRLSRAGRVEFTAQRVDLDEVVARILRAMRLSIEEKGAEVRADRLPPVQGDPMAIEQVFANLLANAVNYLDPERRGKVMVRGAPDGDRPGFVTLSVRDNGLGIPERYLSKLFLPFERLHGARVKGEGIGLALAKRIVERHDGRIWVESREREGTTFFVSLPAAEAAPVGEQPAA